jgi:hypothetical protein
MRHRRTLTGGAWRDTVCVLLLLHGCVAMVSVSNGQPCGDLDFNNDGVFPDSADLGAFDMAFGGAPDPGWDTIDFNRNGIFPELSDYETFLRVFGGGPCEIPDPNAGWTQFTPSRDTIIVHVDCERGNDANPGTSSLPKRTPDQRWVRSGFPDWLMIRAGGTCAGQLGTTAGSWVKSGRGRGEPLVIGTYDIGPDGRAVYFTTARARIAPTNTVGFLGMTSGGVRHLAIVGLHFDAPDVEVPPVGIRFYGQGDDVLVEGCLIEGFGTGVVVEAEGPLTNIRLRRNVIVDSYSKSGSSHSQGIYTWAADGVLVEENVLDHNGWRGDTRYPGAYSTIYNHNAYFGHSTRNVVFRCNITARASATAAQLRGNNASASDNVAIDCPLGFGGGHAMGWATDKWTGTLERNLSIGGGDIGAPGGPREARGMAFQLAASAGGRIVDCVAMLAPGHQAGGDPGVLFLDDSPGGAATVRITSYGWTPAVLARRPQRPDEDIVVALKPAALKGVGDYARAIGVGSTTEDFLRAARGQSRTNWREDLTAIALRNYLLAGASAQ